VQEAIAGCEKESSEEDGLRGKNGNEKKKGVRKGCGRLKSNRE